jgi:predicted dehydrogenase
MDRPARQWLTIHGTDGSLDLADDFVMSRNAPSTLTVGGPWGTRTEHFAPCDPYHLMVESVSAAIRGEAAYLPPPQESARMMGVLEAVREAAG